MLRSQVIGSLLAALTGNCKVEVSLNESRTNRSRSRLDGIEKEAVTGRHGDHDVLPLLWR